MPFSIPSRLIPLLFWIRNAILDPFEAYSLVVRALKWRFQSRRGSSSEVIIAYKALLDPVLWRFCLFLYRNYSNRLVFMSGITAAHCEARRLAASESLRRLSARPAGRNQRTFSGRSAFFTGIPHILRPMVEGYRLFHRKPRHPSTGGRRLMLFPAQLWRFEA